MTASHGDPLADLVTQAPPDASSDVPSQPSIFARLCARVLGRPPSREQASPHKVGKLQKIASVVPVAESTATLPPTSPPRTSEKKQKEISGPLPAATAPAAAETPLAADRIRQQARIWGPQRNEPPQLPPQVEQNIGRKTLVLDLDETLVHSSFRPTAAADLVIDVELEGEIHKVYVRKRPGVDEFMRQVARFYEVVVYTASMAKYANPLLDQLDPSRTVSHRLFREACTRHTAGSGYMKDLSKLGRELSNVIIIDNSPICYALQPDNAIPIRTWRDDPSDRELLDLIPILCSLVSVHDIPSVLRETVWAE